MYLPSSGTAPTSPTQRADWERAFSGAVFLPLVTTKSNTALTDLAGLHGGTNTGQSRWASFVSDTLDSNQTITGTFSMVVRGLEASLAEDAHLAFMLRVMQGDTSTERGLLASVMATTTEFTTSAQTRIHNAVAVSSVSALAGDRLCLEVGIHAVTPANAANITLRFGDPTATGDFALTSGLTTDLVPWAELSQTLTFGTPSAGGPSFVIWMQGD
jgi:hypothetical protein